MQQRPDDRPTGVFQASITPYRRISTNNHHHTQTSLSLSPRIPNRYRIEYGRMAGLHPRSGDPPRLAVTATTSELSCHSQRQPCPADGESMWEAIPCFRRRPVVMARYWSDCWDCWYRAVIITPAGTPDRGLLLLHRPVTAYAHTSSGDGRAYIPLVDR